MAAKYVAPEDADYVCTLDEATLAKAKAELNEDPKNRLGAVDTFRTWIKQQPHIKCPTDTRYLLAFLRARKFSQLEARTLLENFLKRRTKLKQWFGNLDPAEPKVQAALDDIIGVVLPGVDNEGRKVIMIRPGQINPSFKSYKKDDVFRALSLILDSVYFLDESVQVNGSVTVMDFTGYSLKHTTDGVSIDDRRNFLSTWQSNYPARIKQVHLYNEGTFMDFLTMIMRVASSDKIQKRTVSHGKVLETVYKYIPLRMLPEEYQPDDYNGPCPGTFQHIVDGMKQHFMNKEVRRQILEITSDKFKIDLKEKPTVVQQASFRKLNVD